MRRALTVAYNGRGATRTLLALDWAGAAHSELVIGRSEG